MEKTVLQRVREQMKNAGMSEFATVADNPYLQELFDERQALKVEMNLAKKEAAAEAAKPYEELILAIDKQYALYLRLSSK